MKLFKKLAAAVMAAVMSMALLTGCSGGGGSSVPGTGIVTSFTQKVTLVEVNDEPYNGLYTEYLTTNGEWMYTEWVTDTQTQANLSWKGGDLYVVNPKNKKAYKGLSGHPWQTDDTATTTTGTWEYKGKTYRTVEGTTVADGYKQTQKYCYDGAKLAYIVTEGMEEGKTTKTVARVDEWSDKADESKLDINNYTIVNSPDELYS